jgi:tetratricopeptide (TPR) repeat protein
MARGPTNHPRPAYLAVNAIAARHAEAARLFTSGDIDSAVMLFEQVLDDCHGVLGAEHPDTLTTAGNYAVASFAAGYDDGIDLIAANVAERERLLGSDDPRTLTARDALATAYRLAGRIADAVALAAQVTTDRRRVLGDSHPHTLTSRLGMAHSRAAEGDPESGLPLLQSALRDAERELGPLHPHTIFLRANTAGCLAALGRPLEAVPLFQRAVSDSATAFGPNDPITVELDEDLAHVHQPQMFAMHAAIA